MTPPDPIERFFRTQLRLNHLRTLAALAALGQVRKVAEALNVTQSAISKQIGEIETGLGEAVVRRDGNRLLLTPIGHRLAARAREVMDQLDQTRQELTALRDGIHGRLTIGGVATVNAHLIPDAIDRLKERAPEVVVAVKEGTADDLLESVVNGQIGVAVVRMWNPVAHADLAQSYLMDEALVMVVSAAHPLAAETEIGWDGVMDYPWIVPNAGSPAYGAVETLAAAHGHRIPDNRIESIPMSLNIRLCANGNFILFMPQKLAGELAARGEIAILPLDTRNLLSEIRVFWRKDNHDPARDLLITCLREICAAG